MLENILFFVHYGILLLFGVFVSASFTGVQITKKNYPPLLLMVAICGGLQVSSFVIWGEKITWFIYPLIAHFPLAICLYFTFHKKALTIISSIATTYLCCQIVKWLGVFLSLLKINQIIFYSFRILVLLFLGFLLIKYFSSYISRIFQETNQHTLLFCITPCLYYIYDYVFSVYKYFWFVDSKLLMEFLTFFLCIIYLLFCAIYYREYEEKVEAERKEQMVRIIIDGQAKEIEAVRRSEHEIKLLRHDLRLFLNGLAVSIEENDTETALKLITGYSSNVSATSVHRFCENDTINYVLSAFSSKCKEQNIRFNAAVALSDLKTDEIMFTSILSNALDNAINAQKELLESEQKIDLMLKHNDNKLLLSVKNPINSIPVFVDGLPITNQEGHGYGTKSIRYLTERLGGNCQFSVHNSVFIVRVII